MTAPPAPSRPSSSGRSSALVATGIFLSRLLGLARQSLIAKYLGASLVADAFNGAFRITNILQNLFGEGALSASFIPVYAKAVADGDEEQADRVAGAVGAILGLVCAITVALGILAAPLVVKLILGGYTGEKLALTIRLTRILFPGAGIFVLSAWCLGILNSHRRFFLSYAAPVFWNVAMIAALLFYGPRTAGAGMPGEVELAVVLSWASVVGAALQMGVQLPAVFSLLKRPRYALDIGYPPVREVVRNFLPAFMTRGVVQVSGYVDIWLASFIQVDGVVTLLQNAQTIYLLPISLFGMSVSAAELPEMSRDSGTDASAMDRLRVLLQHGKFTSVESVRTWAILGGSAVGLVASSLGRLYSSTFFALRDTRTPLQFAVARVILPGVLGYLFAFPLPRLLGLPAWTGAVGLTASAGISGWLEFLLLRRAITARIGRTGIAPGALIRLWTAGLLAGGAGFGVMRQMDPMHQTIRGVAALGTFAIVYGIATVTLGVPEAKGIARRVWRR